MLELASTNGKRYKFVNKESAFRVNKRPVDDKKIERHLQRSGIGEEELLAMASPVDGKYPSTTT